MLKMLQFVRFPVFCLHFDNGATSGAGTACPSGAPEFTLIFSGVHVSYSILSFVDHYLSFYPLSFDLCVV